MAVAASTVVGCGGDVDAPRLLLLLLGDIRSEEDESEAETAGMERGMNANAACNDNLRGCGGREAADADDAVAGNGGNARWIVSSVSLSNCESASSAPPRELPRR